MIPLEKLYNNFETLKTWEDRFGYIIELGKKIPPFPESEKTEKNRVRGCVSKAWLIKDPSKESFGFLADSEAAIVRGLIMIVMCIFANKTSLEILQTELREIFERLDLLTHLSPNRANGFQSLIKQIQQLCLKDIQSKV